MNKAIIILLVLFLAAACKNSGSRKAIKESDIHEVTVKEAMNAAGYTYMLVSEGRMEQWLAVSEMDVNIGTTYYYQGGLKMVNFKSRELDRVFESIIFVDQISLEPPLPPEEVSLSTAHSTTIPSEKLDISVEVAEGGISLADLVSKKESYDGKTVRIRGQVTKYNAAIMDKNWIHLQDGTEYDGTFDLTITSDVTVETGQMLTFEGKIALDKDFGYGYIYEIIMEEAKIID
jgi:hypothetical protein